jgi:hypothetical protein
MTQRLTDLFTAMKNKLESIITNDISPSFNYTTKHKCYGLNWTVQAEHKLVDDLLIFIDAKPFDGVASGGPCYGSNDGYSRVGLINVNVDILKNYVNNPNDRFTLGMMLHEALHVIGIGTLWNKFKVVEPLIEPKFYNGTNLDKEFKMRTNNYSIGNKVLIEQDFGPGSAYAHFDECAYGNEIMTPVADNDPVFSWMTCSALKDLNYTININNCDPWVVPPKVNCIDGYRPYSGIQTSMNLFNDTLNDIIFE